jgi:hypothetical protein
MNKKDCIEMTEMKSPHYVCQDNPPIGYGNRVWIERTHLTKDIISELKNLSHWGDYDNEIDNKWYSWEISETKTSDARKYLQSQGLNEFSYHRPKPLVGRCKVCDYATTLQPGLKAFYDAVEHANSGSKETFFIPAECCFKCLTKKLVSFI